MWYNVIRKREEHKTKQEDKKMKKAIYFDMDGTIADLYGVNGWLEMLIAESVNPYVIAKPMLEMVKFSKALNLLHKKGYHIGLISWTSKGGTAEYNERVAAAKKFWLTENGYSRFDEIKIVPYGTPKEKAVDFPAGILFDDEEKNRFGWTGKAYTPAEFMEILEAL